jgi:hypothetical protein
MHVVRLVWDFCLIYYILKMEVKFHLERRLTVTGLHVVVSRKVEPFLVTAVRTSYPTFTLLKRSIKTTLGRSVKMAINALNIGL